MSAYYVPSGFIGDNDEWVQLKPDDVIAYQHNPLNFWVERGGKKLRCRLPTGETVTEWRPTVMFSDPTSIAFRVAELSRPFLGLRYQPQRGYDERWVLRELQR